MPSKSVYWFGDGRADGNAGMKDLLGGKGAGVAEMTNAGIPVPPGFTITTEVCTRFYENGRRFPKDAEPEQWAALARVEKSTGMGFGDPQNPLLVSVRSGAKFSMPGMMDTILNLGLNDQTVEGHARRANNPRFAWDCYRRLIQMYSNVVLDVEKEQFEKVLRAKKEARGSKADTDLTVEDLKGLVEAFKGAVKEHSGHEFPQDVKAQLRGARDAVFRSWNNERAIAYRRMYRIPDSIGTAVTVQSMVFGNTGPKSATGVGFTRDPATGERKFYGEFLTNAQGEDVVAGIRTPRPIAELENEMPAAYRQLKEITARLEKHYRDVQDFEFTIQDEKLYMLQTRSGKRTGHAAVKIAVDMVKEKLITPKEAVGRVEPAMIEQLLHPVFDPLRRREFPAVAKGLNASPGAAAGKAVFDAPTAVAWKDRGERVVLLRAETCPDDIKGMAAAKGVLTSTGGRTSHAAVVGRQMGRPSVVGCTAVVVDEEHRRATVDGKVIKEGDYVSIDGTTGEVMIGDVPTRDSDILEVMRRNLDPSKSETWQNFAALMKWADGLRRLKVRANADIPRDAEAAVALGAEGIGLCRTEHMFFAPDRLPIVQEMIMAGDEAGRRAALERLVGFQRDDFYGLFKTMAGRPVTIRTLDPPLHEFLPRREELMVEIAEMNARGQKGPELTRKETLLARVEQLHEFNPMLGLRGCRLGILYPEITEMQARAIFEAACRCAKEKKPVVPEVMIPLVGHVNELKHQAALVRRVADEVMKKEGVKVKYLVGTMIEVPRAALTAAEVAGEAEFFSFGTNDLTQMTFGYSRDDAGKFLPLYVSEKTKILPDDPFVTIDKAGVGQLVRMSVENGRSVRADLKCGICGEHGGEPETVIFCHDTGLNYVSCSPYRVPVARLAAAHAVLREDARRGEARKPATKKGKRMAGTRR
ncbi:MAG: pyruvate, phosphate dikinase [Planctomycetes bacterium]|nr:pyruvate, phosphate dikinase [Planctomycetota bacterium]